MNLTRKPIGWGVAVAALLAGASGSFAPAPARAQDAVASVDLIQVYAEALKSNAAFRAQLAAVEIVSQARAETYGHLLPQVDVQGLYDYGHEHVKGDFYTIQNVDEKDDFPRGLVGVKLTQPLYRPDLWLSDNLAELRKTQAQFQLDAAEDALLVSVAEAYFGVLAAQDAQRFAFAEYDAVNRQLEQIHGRFDAGLVTDADYQAAVATQAIAAAKRIESQSALSEAYANLDLAAGKPFRYLKSLPEGLMMVKPDPPEPVAWIDRARTQNQSVLAAQVAVQMASVETERTRKLRWPRLDAVGSVQYLDSGGGLTGNRDETEERIGLAVSMPIYSGGSVTASIAQSEANDARVQALYDAAVAEAGRDVQVAFLESMGGLTQVPARKTAVEAARVAEQSFQAGFDAGTRTSSDVLRATEARYEAERVFSAARYKFVVDSLKLKRAAGNLANADLSVLDRLLQAPAEPPPAAPAP